MDIKKAFYRVSVKALIYNDEWEFLLCKEDNWVWDIPWGGLDHWESIEICIIRELQEEMWLEVTHINSIPKYFVTAHKTESKTRPWLVNVFYEVKVKNLNFTPSDECIEIKFFNKETVKNVNTIVNVDEFIKQL